MIRMIRMNRSRMDYALSRSSLLHFLHSRKGKDFLDKKNWGGMANSMGKADEDRGEF